MLTYLLRRLRERMDHGFLIVWFKNDGDTFKEGDILFSVGVEEEVIEVLAERSGTILEIFHKGGTHVRVGDVLASIDNNLLDVKSSDELEAHRANSDPMTSIADPKTTTRDVINSRASQGIESGQIPMLQRLQQHSTGICCNGFDESDLIYTKQSWHRSTVLFGDLDLISNGGLDDDVINIPCFDEDLCKTYKGNASLYDGECDNKRSLPKTMQD